MFPQRGRRVLAAWQARGEAGGDACRVPPVTTLSAVETDDGLDDDGPVRPLLPPDDRLWRHPSEVGASGAPVSSTLTRDPRPAVQGRVWAVAIVAGVVGAVAASSVGMLSGAFDQQTTVVKSVSQSPALTLASTGSSAPAVDWRTVDDAIAPSVVAIQVNGASGPATGSGTMMLKGDDSSYVITDSSLVAGGGSISVSFLSGETVHGKLVASDPLSGLALVAVPNGHGMFPVFGTVADLQDASPVLAVGARTWPGGSVFAGSVSGSDREVDTSTGQSMQNMIAITSVQIPPSAAGGPLVDSDGRVVGVTVALDPTDPTDQQLTFAVPIDLARNISQEMVSDAVVQHPWLGITDAVDLSSAIATQLGVSGGAQIAGLWPGGPASHAGLSPNDIIIAFNGTPVTSTGALTTLLAATPPGKAVPISYIHNRTQRSGIVVISNQPSGS